MLGYVTLLLPAGGAQCAPYKYWELGLDFEA